MRISVFGGRVVLQIGTAPKSESSPALKRRLKKTKARIRRQERQIERLQAASAQARGSSAGRPEAPRAEAKEPEAPLIFFVVGQGKSGTGWLREILDFHPEVLCLGEGRFFGRAKRNESLVNAHVSGKRGTRRQIPPSSLYNAIAESEFLRLWIERSVWTRDDEAEEHLGEIMRLATEHFLTQRLAKTKKRLVGDKTPFFGPKDVREIAEVFPEAKVLHIIRDGRDQAVSRMHHFWQATPGMGFEGRDGAGLRPEEIAIRDAFEEDRKAFMDSDRSIFLEDRLRRIVASWRDNVSGATQYGRGLPRERYTEVRYEDLQERPAEEARRLFRFLGAKADEEVVRRCVEAASFEARAGRQRGLPAHQGKAPQGHSGRLEERLHRARQRDLQGRGGRPTRGARLRTEPRLVACQVGDYLQGEEDGYGGTGRDVAQETVEPAEAP